MKPWEETWTWLREWSFDSARGEWTGIIQSLDDPAQLYVDVTGDDALPEHEGRMKLAAAAPDMYRTLEAIETYAARRSDVCPSCRSMPSGTAPMHYAGCALDAALRKARGER